MTDSFGTKSQLKVGSATYDMYSLGKLAKAHASVNRLPVSLKVLLENLLRHEDGRVVKREHIEKMLAWDPKATPPPPRPSRRTRSWSSSATASATPSCAGARARSRASAWCRRTSASATRSTWSSWPA